MTTELKLNGIPKINGFLLSKQLPLDARSVVTEYTHLTELVNKGAAYVGMLVYVNSTDNNKGLYICESITDGGSWKPVATSTTVGDIVIPEVDLTNYATKDYVDNAIDEINLSDYVKTNDLPDTSKFITEVPSEYITESELDSRNYLTEHQDLSHKADKEHSHEEYALKEHEHEQYITEHQDLSHLALKEHKHDEYLTEHQSLADYALKTDIPDVSEFIKEIPSEYITESELASKGYLTEHQNLDHKADKEHSHEDYALKEHEHKQYLTEHQSLKGYATETYVDNAVSSIPKVDLGDYAKKSEVPDITGLATEKYVDDSIATIDIKDVDLSGYAEKEHSHFGTGIWYDDETSVTAKLNYLEDDKLSLTAGGTMSGKLYANGNIMISNSNPHIGFESNGQIAYIQTYNDDDNLGEKVGFGYGWANSLKLDSSGNIYEKGISLEQKYEKLGHTHSYLPLSGGTLSGNLTGQYLCGTLLQTTSAGNMSANASKIAVIDNSGWIYYRTPTQILGDIGAASSNHNHDSTYATKSELNSLIEIDETGTKLIINI